MLLPEWTARWVEKKNTHNITKQCHPNSTYTFSPVSLFHFIKTPFYPNEFQLNFNLLNLRRRKASDKKMWCPIRKKSKCLVPTVLFKNARALIQLPWQMDFYLPCQFQVLVTEILHPSFYWYGFHFHVVSSFSFLRFFPNFQSDTFSFCKHLCEIFIVFLLHHPFVKRKKKHAGRHTNFSVFVTHAMKFRSRLLTFDTWHEKHVCNVIRFFRSKVHTVVDFIYSADWNLAEKFSLKWRWYNSVFVGQNYWM